jgi:4a-hydroxytetrahydrobiopterin dehydratase
MKKDEERTRVTPDLADRRCGACRDAKAPMSAEEVAGLLWELDGWEAPKGRVLVKEWKFRDFASALAFVDRVGALAEAEGHHPDLVLKWGCVRAEIFTHKVGGLTEADFVLAAKIDRLGV